MATVDVSRYLDLPYALEVRLEIDTEGRRFYTATHPELLGCRSQGTTPDEAVEALREARELYLGALIEAGLDVPPPKVLTPQRQLRPLFPTIEVPTEKEPAKVSFHD